MPKSNLPKPAKTPTKRPAKRALVERDIHFAVDGIMDVSERLAAELVPLADAIATIAHTHGSVADETPTMSGREAAAIAALAVSVSGQLSQVAADLERRALTFTKS